ncbi:hypothetical protein FB451DRAFT_1034350, partial [Mycena latifolia]
LTQITVDPASEATARYLRIRKSADPEVHLPYLRTMFALRGSTHLPQIVEHLCKVLDLHANPDHRFADLLWEIILGERGAIAAPIQECILGTMWTRLGAYPYVSATRNPKPTGHAFDTVSRRHIRLGVSVSHLCAALATTLFPHFRLYLPPVVWTWAVSESKAVFRPQNPADARWSNLVMLALYAAPTALSNGGGGLGVTIDEDAGTGVVWRTVFALAMFERTISHDAPDSVRHAVRRLWRMWKNADVAASPLVCRVVVGAFLRLAARTHDGPLKDACQRYCVAHELWGVRAGETKADVVQTTELFVDYAYAALHTEAQDRVDVWQGIFAALPPDSAAVPWRARVSDALFRAFLAQDVAAAQELHEFCQRHAIALSTDSAHALGLVLAADYFPDEALHLLTDARFTPDQTEELLDRIVRTLRRERHGFRDLPLADALIPVMEKLYIGTERIPRNRTNFSLRYALSVMATSERSAAAMKLMRVIHERQPAFFSIHYFLRTMRTLVNRQQPAHALGLLKLVQRFPPLARENFQRKLALRLARKKAHTLAEQAYRYGGVRRARWTTRESLARAVSFRVRAPARLLSFKISALLAWQPTHVPTIRYAVALLVRAGRLGAARHVLARAHAAGVDAETVTWLGNMLLDGAMQGTKSKHARLVRHVLKTRDLLVERFGFTPDRVTVNIIVKVLLRWKPYVDAAQIRRLFDHMVRSGYPVAARWRREDGVPFGTQGGEAGSAISMLGLPRYISFDKHVRPLYKMFIKGLHLQGDRLGAQTVIAILRSAEAEVLARRQMLRRARLAGIVRKAVRMRDKRREKVVRKLADAFHSLDQAVDPPPPPKRPHMARSLYSTLAKYGVKPRQTTPPTLSKSTPHLTAILARAATRTRKALPFASSATPPPPLPPTAEYRPSSIPSFLARLATFKLATYANKPSQIDAVAAAKCGWVNDGKDRLVCGLCGVSWVVAGREGMTRDAGEDSKCPRRKAARAARRDAQERLSLENASMRSCVALSSARPAGSHAPAASIYRIPLQSPAVTIREIKTTALVLDPIMQEMETASQLASLRATITAFALPPPAEDAAQDATPPPDPSETAVLTALFGWAPAPPATERPRMSSLSRPSSRAASRAGSPFSSTPRPALSRASSLAIGTSASASASTPRDTSLLHCALCQRRVGLWAFAPPTEPSTPPPHARAPAPQRHFDLLKEHRSFCPYVVRSTLVPTLPAEPVPSPSPSAGVLEGWRAVLTVVLRYGMAQRQRAAALRRKHPSSSDVAMDVDGGADPDADADAEVDGVEAMVASVKSRGGKELLKYVKGLLG